MQLERARGPENITCAMIKDGPLCRIGLVFAYSLRGEPRVV